MIERRCGPSEAAATPSLTAFSTDTIDLMLSSHTLYSSPTTILLARDEGRRAEAKGISEKMRSPGRKSLVANTPIPSSPSLSFPSPPSFVDEDDEDDEEGDHPFTSRSHFSVNEAMYSHFVSSVLLLLLSEKKKRKEKGKKG